jgi:hypothetical protein
MKSRPSAFCLLHSAFCILPFAFCLLHSAFPFYLNNCFNAASMIAVVCPKMVNARASR